MHGGHGGYVNFDEYLFSIFLCMIFACVFLLLNSLYIKNIIKECCRIPISERRHLWGLYRVVIILFSIYHFLINFQVLQFYV